MLDQINNLDIDWQNFLLKQQQLKYFKKINTYLHQESLTSIIYPAKQNYFKALAATPVNKIKIVILGQDPYHKPYQATGLCFAVPNNVPPPPSLKNIFNAIEYDLNTNYKKNTDLIHWARQGVLLLNTILTVRANEANSHKNIGWQTFTENILTYINQQPQHIVFLLWGNQAQSYLPYINQRKNSILIAPHPSPLSAYRGFITCKHFSQANNALIKNNQQIINW